MPQTPTLIDTLRRGGTEALGHLDATGQLLKGLALQPVSGLAGASQGIADLLRGKGLDESLASANKRIEQVQGWGGGPQTERGGELLQTMGQTLEPVVEKLHAPADWIGEKSPLAGAAAMGFTELADPTKLAGKVKTASRAAKTAIETAKAAKGGLRGDIEAATAAVEGAGHTRARQDMTPAQATAAGLTPTVDNPQRVAYPGIYKPSSQIAEEAKALVSTESPLLKRLFGVTREDLQGMSARQGNIQDPIRELIPGAAAKPKGSAAVQSIMTPANVDRILSGVTQTRRVAPELAQGMQGWYVMDPLYHRMVELHGGDEAAALKAYDRLNSFGGVESPNMAVPNETRRAFAANYLQQQGRFPEWMQHGGTPADIRNRQGLLPDLETVPGRVGHQRASAAQQRIIDTGEHGMDSPKAPLYIAASGVPQGRFQTNVPVGDAHFSRASGLADTRTSKDYEASISTPELQMLSPWFNKEIADPLNVGAVSGQGEMWGVFAPQTGVKTQIGAPKLEIIADLIGNRAGKLGRSDLENLRDEVLMGKQHLGRITPGAAAATGAGAAGTAAMLKALREREDETVGAP